MCCLGFDPSYLGGMNDLICFERFDKIKKPPKIKITIPGYFYPKEKSKSRGLGLTSFLNPAKKYG